MVKLTNLIEKTAEYADLNIIHVPKSDRLVSRVDILTPETLLDPESLYICTDENILKNSKLLKKMSDSTLPYMILTDVVSFPFFYFDGNDSGSALSKPVLGKKDETNPDITEMNLPGGTDIAMVIQAEEIRNVPCLFRIIHEYLKFESRLQKEINDLYHLLYTGKGLEGIVRQAEAFLKRPISVLDASYSMIAVSPLMLQLPFGMETSEEGHFLSMKEVDSLRRLQIENQIYQNNQAFFIQTEDHPDTNWIFCAIRIQHVMSGYVAVCLPDRADATEHELRLTTVLSDICAIEMQKHDFFIQRTGLQYETFFNELLEGRYSNLNMIESRFKVLNHHLGKFFCLAILFCNEPHNSELFNKQQMSALRKIYPHSMSVVYKNNIVLLLNQDTPVLLNQELTGPLEQFAFHNNLKVSLSQPFADILKIRIFYEQALHTLELSDVSSAQLLFFSTEALPEYLFSKCNYKELETGIHYHIFQLQDYDREFHTEFITTLRAYLNHDRNATKTAEYLHIHRSTFFYRIKKIEELLNISITDSKLMFLYELSFKIWDYLSK